MYFFKKIFRPFQIAAARFVFWAERFGWWKVGLGLLLIVLIVWAALHFLGGSAPAQAPAETTRQVEIKSVTTLSSDQPELSLVGVVHSQSEATVRAERSGQIVSVSHALGDSVSAGATVAEMENASERAAVLQAQGVVDAAQANLSKTTGGARPEQRSILQSGVESVQSSLTSAKTSAVNALLSAYATIDNAIHSTVDSMFSNPDSPAPHFNITSPNSQLITNIENTRLQISIILTREATKSTSLTEGGDLHGEIAATESELRSVKNYLDSIVIALTTAIPTASVPETTIAGYLADAKSARTAVNAALSGLASADESLSAKKSAIDVAQKNLEQGVAGGQPEDVASAQASVKQAQGALAAARANLEKTIIRAPISGTINSFSLHKGDYAQAASPVLSVANNGALEIITYVSENDSRDITVGTSVSIEGGSQGTITKIAPALDPETKKIEVRIGLTNNDKELLNGQSVIVSMKRGSKTETATPEKKGISIPIAAIKIGADQTSVFTISSDMTLVQHAVTLGVLQGDRVQIQSGLTPDMVIVTDARGLREGQIVTVK